MKGIAARSLSGVLGKDGKIPWHCPGDLSFFRKKTLNQNVVFGRTTFVSLPALKNRNIFVLSRSKSIISGATVINCIEEIPEDAWVCGGAEIYKQLIPMCNEFYLTTIKIDIDGDTYFPIEMLNGWDEEVIEDNETYSISRYTKN